MKFLFILITLLFITHSFTQNQWVQKDSINGAPRSVASAFVLNGEGYVLAGLDDNGFRRKMYSYTFWQDDWDDEASIGGVSGSGLARGSASSFSIYNKGYICLGQGATNPFFNDLWEYDPITKIWTQKADFIGSARRSAVAFTLNDTIAYVGTGISTNGFEKDMYKYSSTTNTWTQISDFGGTARKEAVGFTMGGQGYIGTGDDGIYRNDFWQYQPDTDTWIQKADFPGTPRKGAVGWGIFPSAFIATGEDNTFTYKKDVWEYNYFSDTWVQRADFMGEGRSNAIVFVLQDLAFVGSGSNGEFKDDVYAYRRIVGVNEMENQIDFSIYPNPIKANFNVKTNIQNAKFQIISLDGKTIPIDGIKTPEGYKFIRPNSPAGQYFLQITDLNSSYKHQNKITLL